MAIPVAGGDDPVLAALRGQCRVLGHACRTPARPRPRSPSWSDRWRKRGVDRRTGPRAEPMGQTVALMHDEAGPEAATPPAAEAGESAVEAAHDPGRWRGRDRDRGDRSTRPTPCAGERRIAAERCGLAVRCAGRRERGRRRPSGWRNAPTTSTCRRADAAAAIADPRAVRREKEAAQARFRAGVQRRRRRPRTPRRRPATGWPRSTTSTTRPARPRPPRSASAPAATASGAQLEHLSLEADAARIAAETAEAACLVARQALAECDERVDRPGRGPARCRAGTVGRATGPARQSRTTSRSRRPSAPAARRRSSGSCAATASR